MCSSAERVIMEFNIAAGIFHLFATMLVCRRILSLCYTIVWLAYLCLHFDSCQYDWMVRGLHDLVQYPHALLRGDGVSQSICTRLRRQHHLKNTPPIQNLSGIILVNRQNWGLESLSRLFCLHHNWSVQCRRKPATSVANPINIVSDR